MSLLGLYLVILLVFGTFEAYAKSDSTLKNSKDENFKILTKDFLDNKMGRPWKGLLYICNPYCEFLSVKEAENWIPKPKEVEMDTTKLKFIAKEDPIYPLLIKSSPVLPYIDSKNVKETNPEKGQKDNTPGIPKYAEMPFNIGWAAGLGSYLSFSNLSSTSSIQSDMNDTKGRPGLNLTGGVMLGKSKYIFGQWIQNQLYLDIHAGEIFKTRNGDKKFSVSKNLIYHQVLITTPKFKHGPVYGVLQESIKTTLDSIESYSQSRNIIWLGWSLFINRIGLEFSTNLISKISESLSFRQSPLEEKWYKLSANYCSKNTPVFDILLSFCGNYIYENDIQTSALNPEIFLQDKMTLSRESHTFTFIVKFGEDFRQ